MARGIEGNEISSQPKKSSTPSTAKAGMKQQGIAGFFQKKTVVTPAKRLSDEHDAKDTSKATDSSVNITPAGSNGALSSSSPPRAPGPSQGSSVDGERNKENGTDSKFNIDMIAD